MRLGPEQLLLDRYLNSDTDSIDRDAMATLKSMAQDAMDRAGIHVSDPSKYKSYFYIQVPIFPTIGDYPVHASYVCGPADTVGRITLATLGETMLG